jgi:hypothetical protein
VTDRIPTFATHVMLDGPTTDRVNLMLDALRQAHAAVLRFNGTTGEEHDLLGLAWDLEVAMAPFCLSPYCSVSPEAHLKGPGCPGGERS